MTDNHAHWRKSSYSGSQAECVEVGSTPGTIQVRDTTNRDGGTLSIPADAWSAFMQAIK